MLNKTAPAGIGEIKMCNRLVVVVLCLMSSTKALAVDWLQDTEVIFSQLRSTPGWTCESALNMINGAENALECTIKGVNARRTPYRVTLGAYPAPSGKWVQNFAIAVSPLNAIPDAAINDHYLRIADFPFLGGELRHRFRSVDDMLAVCKRQKDSRPRECDFRESGNDFAWLTIHASDARRDETFFSVMVSAGRNKRCLQDPECLKSYLKAKPSP